MLELGLQAVAGQDVGEQVPLPMVTEAQIKAQEVREDSMVDLSLRLPCSVSFQRGKERSVFFTLTGLPEVLLSLTGPPPGAPLTGPPVLRRSVANSLVGRTRAHGVLMAGRGVACD